MENGRINNKINLYNDCLAFQFSMVICSATDIWMFELVINRQFSYFCRMKTSHLLRTSCCRHFHWYASSFSKLIADTFCFRMNLQYGKWNPIADSQGWLNKLSINWCQAESFSLYLSSDSLACQQGWICLMHCHNLQGLDDVQCWFCSSWFSGTQPTNVQNSILVWQPPRPKNVCVK